MTFRFEMVRGGPGGQHFSIASGTWDRLIPLAKARGWQPAGTIIEPWPVKRHDLEGTASDYAPDEWLYAKRFADDDARAFAEALRKVAEDCRAEKTKAADILAGTALQLAGYCDGGGFLFAYDD